MRILHERVLVEPIAAALSKGGLILPSSENENKGTVILIGDKVKTLKIDDTVKYHKQAGIPVEHNGKYCLLMSEEHEVIATI